MFTDIRNTSVPTVTTEHELRRDEDVNEMNWESARVSS